MEKSKKMYYRKFEERIIKKGKNLKQSRAFNLEMYPSQLIAKTLKMILYYLMNIPANLSQI